MGPVHSPFGECWVPGCSSLGDCRASGISPQVIMGSPKTLGELFVKVHETTLGDYGGQGTLACMTVGAQETIPYCF